VSHVNLTLRFPLRFDLKCPPQGERLEGRERAEKKKESVTQGVGLRGGRE
jgi:hypothetical protein